MTSAVAAVVPSGRSAPAVRRPRSDERWARGEAETVARPGFMDMGLVAASVVFHISILALAVAGSKVATRPPSSEPVPVEIVREVPDRTPPPPPQAPEHPAPTPAAEPERPSARSARQDLQDQLAALQAERETLKREEGRLEQQARLPAPGALGPLPDSFQAVALPSGAAGEGEAVGYAALVFSQLAKAKDITRHMGEPGSAGVHFDIDAAGGLVDVELVVSSGIPSLDAEALATVRKAAPFPAPPQGAQRSFSANVSFVAEGGAP